jgi:hypothetical protein
MKNAVIVLLLVLAAFMAQRIIHIENQRYALVLGMCPNTSPEDLLIMKCLDETETRTHWVWHLYYGLTSRYL